MCTKHLWIRRSSRVGYGYGAELIDTRYWKQLRVNLIQHSQETVGPVLSSVYNTMGEEPLYEELHYDQVGVQRRQTANSMSFLGNPAEAQLERDNFHRYIGVESKRVEYLDADFESEAHSERGQPSRKSSAGVRVHPVAHPVGATNNQFEAQSPISSYPASSEMLARRPLLEEAPGQPRRRSLDYPAGR